MLGVAGMVMHPPEIESPLKNPYKGWVIIDHAIPGQMDAGQSITAVKDGTPYEWYENAAVLSTWAAIETTPDRFDWTMMDQCITYWASLGKRIHLRFATDDFGAIPGCPRWLFEMGVPKTVRNHQQFPDYTHPKYLERLKKFLAVFAGRYADDPRIETVNLQGYGDFGEWHSGADYDTVTQRVAALRGIVDCWRHAFGGRKLLNLSSSYEWMTRYNVEMDIRPLGTSIYADFPPSYHEYLHRSVFDYAYTFPDVTLSRHGCAGAVKGEYDGRLIATYFQHWRKPMYMEFFGGIDHYTGPSLVGFAGTKPGDNFVSNAMDELLTHHPTYATPMGWGAGGAGGGIKGNATAFYNDYHDLMLRTLNLMGYRFVLVESQFPETIAPGAEWTLRHSWENRAMGRCYHRFPLAVYLMQDSKVIWSAVDNDFDQTAFVAGETYDLTSRFKLPRDLAPGKYNVRIAMVNTSGQPAISLAIAGGDENKRYDIGTVTVDSSVSTQPSALTSVTVHHQDSRWMGDHELPPNATFLVTFRYEITRNPERDLDTDDPGYFRFYIEGDGKTREDEIRWYDKAGYSSAWKTAIVNTHDAVKYTLKWEAVGGGSMTISDVRFEAIPASRVRRVAVNNNDVVRKSGAIIEEQTRISASRDRAEVVLPDDRYEFLETHPANVPLKPNTTYTVWFNSACRPQVWQGDYHYLSIRSANGGTASERGFWRWTQRFTSNPVRHAYTFTTGSQEDYRLVWGMHNGGLARISWITLIER